MKILDRVNIIQIFIKHKNTLYDYGELTWNGNHRMPFSDLFTFFILPFLISIVLVIPFKLQINENYLSIIITSLSIFVGLLFSLLTLVFDIAIKEKEKKNKEISHEQKIKSQLVRELFINIAFAIALSILSIITSLLTRFHPKPLIVQLQKLSWYLYIKSFYLCTTNIISIFLIILFLLTLLMILKRFFLIFTNEIDIY